MPLHPNVAGSSRVPRREFQRRLGLNAVVVWSLLTRRRDGEGLAHPTVTGLARSAEGQRLSERTVKRALARLRAVGIVEDVGWRLMDVPRGRGVAPAEVYVRRVWGAWAGDFVTLPAHLWGRVMALEPRGHGGARRGAGRPPEYVSMEAWVVAQRLRGRLYAAWAHWEKTGRATPEMDPEFGFSYRAIFEKVGRRPGPGSEWHLDHVLPLSRFDLARPEEVRRAFAPENHQWLPKQANLRKSSKVPAWVGDNLTPLAAPAVGDNLTPGGGGKMASGGEGASGPPMYAQATRYPLDPFLRKGSAAGAAALQEVEKMLPARLVPKGLPPHFEKAWRSLTVRPPGVTADSLMPPHPEPGEIHVTIPPPPRVPEHLDRDDQLVFCARWFRAAVESRGVECPPLAPRGSHRRYFEDFLEVCLEKRIRPGAWVAWALDRILARLPTHARRRFRPQIKVLLSPKTLTEHRWMFREVEADYCTPELRKSEAGEQLMAAWRQAKAEIAAGGATREAAERALRAAWPEGYAPARRKAAENTRAEGQEVLERIRFGEWIWPLPKALRGARGEATGR